MTNVDNVIDGPWEGGEPTDMTDAEIQTAMDELMSEMDLDKLNQTVSAVLEYMTVRAVMDCGYYIMTDDHKAMAVFAADDDVALLMAGMPEHFKCLNDEISDEFITNADPGDEQDEPATESE